jgi:hypothetical protein
VPAIVISFSEVVAWLLLELLMLIVGLPKEGHFVDF